MKINLTIWCSLIIFVMACKSTKETAVPASEFKPRTNLNADDILVSMSKGGCFGTCPVYTIDIYKDGYANFIGTSNTSKVGNYAKMLDKQTVKTLQKAFDDADFMSMQDFYESNIPDLPSVTISYRKKDNFKTVKGKRERPEELHKIQNQIEILANSESNWVLVRTIAPEKQEPQFDKKKIIIAMKNTPSIKRWFNSMKSQYGLQIFERLDGTDGDWLISFNDKIIKPDEFLELLNNDEMITSAKFKPLEN